ncbi:MAG: tRNA lysidine(34) synthetase TilS [Anaerolineae bacterium]|nr:tRNA lysidine(34) synthetase TilS [Anaerolineae bacterium]
MELSTIERFLATECGLNKSQPVLLGLSGGPDSLSLLDVLLHFGYPVIAAHFNHKLRPESGKEADYVWRLAEQLGVRFVCGSMAVTTLAQENKWTVEEAARTARYQFLFQEARRFHAQAVAIAHTADDQVETVLMHILRGSGLAGLRGMGFRAVQHEWDAQIPIVRPFLEVWRQEILEYCKERKLEPIFDQSNLDEVYFRNRIRLQLIPYLEQYNPKVKQALRRMSRILEADTALLEDTVNQAWKECLIAINSLSVILDNVRVKKLPLSLQRMVLRKAMAFLLQGEEDIEYEAIERGRKFISSPSRRGRIELSGGMSLYLTGEWLAVARREEDLPRDNWPQFQGREPIALDAPFRVTLNHSWVLEGEMLSSHSALAQINDPRKAWLDADCLQFPLLLRTMRPGERFQPLGMEGKRVKLSDFWVNLKMPRFVRKNWPLVVSNDQIVWIPGQRMAHACRLTERTKRVLYLCLGRQDTEKPDV